MHNHNSALRVMWVCNMVFHVTGRT